MTGTAAAFLTAELLGGVSHLAAVLGLGGTLALVAHILENVQIDHVVIGLDAEDLLVEDDLLSGLSSVDLVNRQFHNLSLQN